MQSTYLLLISVLFTGEAREVHQICVLVGYGADAICPYMVFEIAQMLREENVIDVNDQTAYENYAAAVDRGISKVRFQIFVGKARCLFIRLCKYGSGWIVWAFVQIHRVL